LNKLLVAIVKFAAEFTVRERRIFEAMRASSGSFDCVCRIKRDKLRSG